MTDKGIPLSPRYGVNPSLGQCFYCLNDDGTVVLAGKLKGDQEAPLRAVWSIEPCPECKSLMKQGCILVSVRDENNDPSNPYRTGGWVVVKDEAIERMLDAEAASDVLQRRFAFVPDEVWDAIGLPRGAQE